MNIKPACLIAGYSLLWSKLVAISW